MSYAEGCASRVETATNCSSFNAAVSTFNGALQVVSPAASGVQIDGASISPLDSATNAGIGIYAKGNGVLTLNAVGSGALVRIGGVSGLDMEGGPISDCSALLASRPYPFTISQSASQPIVLQPGVSSYVQVSGPLKIATATAISAGDTLSSQMRIGASSVQSGGAGTGVVTFATAATNRTCDQWLPVSLGGQMCYIPALFFDPRS